MPNVERVFPNTHIGGAGAGVVAIPNMDVYVPFNGVDEGLSLIHILQFSANGNAVLDGIMSSWEARSTSQDIISQKQSDATLGYERVYDTQTGEIYRAENGWSDTYQGGRYEPVTDDSMYTEPISGYIE